MGRHLDALKSVHTGGSSLQNKGGAIHEGCCAGMESGEMPTVSGPGVSNPGDGKSPPAVTSTAQEVHKGPACL